MSDARNRAILTLNNSTSKRLVEIREKSDELECYITNEDWELAKFAAASLNRLCELQEIQCEQLKELRRAEG